MKEMDATTSYRMGRLIGATLRLSAAMKGLGASAGRPQKDPLVEMAEAKMAELDNTRNRAKRARLRSEILELRSKRGF